jgi:pimeloyl-ACP methyl ester carboxylesterase
MSPKGPRRALSSRLVPDSELKALGDLAGRYADEALLSPIQGVHSAISERVFGAVGNGSTVAKQAHDAVSAGVYGALRLSSKGAGMAISAAGRVAGGTEERTTVSDSGFGRGAQAAINGLIGDRLEEEGSPLAVKMALRLPHRDVECTRQSIEASFERTTPRLAIFIHGLCETEQGWWFGTKVDPNVEGPAPRTYGQKLRDDLDFSPLYLRYNSGLHISENGRKLSWLLEELVREWPVEVTEVALIGHSMGGLIARSACHEADEAGRRWVRSAKHVVCLGSPNTGSWLEKVVNAGGAAFKRVPETKPFADFLELRAAGIKDLRYGYLRDEDWLDRDADELLRNHSEPAAPVPGIAYHFVSGGLTGSKRHPLGALIGDVLVRRASAAGPTGPDGTPHGDTKHVQGTSHFHLLNNPRTYEHIREWLSRPLLKARANGTALVSSDV